MVHQVLVPIRHHCPTPIPPPAADDVHGIDGEGVGGTHDGANIGIVFKVLDSDVQAMPALIDVLFDRFPAPVAVGIDDVATVAFSQQLWVVFLGLWPLRQRTFPRAYAMAALVPLGRALGLVCVRQGQGRPGPTGSGIQGLLRR